MAALPPDGIWVTGAVIAIAILPLAAVALPESLSFLIDRQPPRALSRVNAVLRRFDRPAVSQLPSARRAGGPSYAALFAPGMAAVTLGLTVVNLLVATAAYFLLNWLPQIVADAGFRPETASLVSALASIVGVFSGLGLGALAPRVGARRLSSGLMVGFGLALAIFGFMPRSLSMITLIAGICGFLLFGTTAVFYGVLANAFSASTRASGCGLVMGVGRVASAAGPYVAGTMFASGLSLGEVSLTFAGVAGLAGLILAVLPVFRSPI